VRADGRAGHELAYVALAVRDPDVTARAFEEHLGLRSTALESGQGKVPVIGVGSSALALFPLGHPYTEGQDKPGVHHIALAARDPEAAAHTVTRTGATTEPTSAPALGGGRRFALDAAATASVKTWFSGSLDLAGSSPSVERIDHIGVASTDNAAAIEAWCHRLGCPLESQQTDLEFSIAVESFTSDKYGAVHHTHPVETVGGLRVAFITVGEVELEFLQPFDPRRGAHVGRQSPGTTRQDQGAIAKFITARGAGLHHVALKTSDIAVVLDALGRAGLPLIDRRGRPGSRRALIGFVHPDAFGGVLVHFVERP
jgi:catechol 2,3-dioxygenase-like lactoylglutathione lyase family enzyme